MQVQCEVKMSIVLVSNGVGASFQNNVITFAKYTRQNLPYHIHIGLNVNSTVTNIILKRSQNITIRTNTITRFPLPTFPALRCTTQPSYPHSTEDYYCSQ